MDPPAPGEHFQPPWTAPASLDPCSLAFPIRFIDSWMVFRLLMESSLLPSLLRCAGGFAHDRTMGRTF